MNISVLPASCRQINQRTALPTGRRQHAGRSQVQQRKARKKFRELCMNLPGHRIAACLGKSGAEDARTPNADASSADSTGSAKPLECVRFIGAFRLAPDGHRFLVPMHAQKRKGALHDLVVRATPVYDLAERFLTLNPNLNRRTESTSTSKITSKSKTDSRFIVPMHAQKRKEALHE